LKTVYIVEVYGLNGKTERHEFDTQDLAQAFVDEKLAPLNGNWRKQPDNSDLPFYDFYIEPVQRIYLLHTSWITRPSIYDITDPEISAREPDSVSVESLRRGDMIGRWMNVRMTVEIENPLLLPTEIDPIALERLKEQLAAIDEMPLGEIVVLPAAGTVTPFEPVLICYVASIQPDEKYKVYMDWGDTSDIERCARDGRKVRSEALARQLFPMLNDYEFIVS